LEAVKKVVKVAETCPSYDIGNVYFTVYAHITETKTANTPIESNELCYWVAAGLSIAFISAGFSFSINYNETAYMILTATRF